MEEEAQKLRQFTTESEAQSAVRVDPSPAGSNNTPQTTPSLMTTAEAPNEDATMEEDPAIVDARSVYVGNVG